MAPAVQDILSGPYGVTNIIIEFKYRVKKLYLINDCQSLTYMFIVKFLTFMRTMAFLEANDEECVALMFLFVNLQSQSLLIAQWHYYANRIRM